MMYESFPLKLCGKQVNGDDGFEEEDVSKYPARHYPFTLSIFSRCPRKNGLQAKEEPLIICSMLACYVETVHVNRN